jgi:hypothetical protein
LHRPFSHLFEQAFGAVSRLAPAALGRLAQALGASALPWRAVSLMISVIFVKSARRTFSSASSAWMSASVALLIFPLGMASALRQQS